MYSNSDQSGQKSMRSVFVGNIPYGATEENLRDLFGEVGPIVSFKLICDRETGRPRGFGFVEYEDHQTALRAIKQLNNWEIGGRQLRVDNASSQKRGPDMRNRNDY